LLWMVLNVLDASKKACYNFSLATHTGRTDLEVDAHGRFGRTLGKSCR
jgi:hypothetical protein